MTLLDRYIGKEFLRAFGMAIFALVLIFVFFDLIEKMRIETDAPRYHLGLYLLYTVPQIASWMTPAALILGVSFTVASFSVNKELIAIYSGGISFYRAIRTILIGSAFLVVFQFFFQNFIVTPANELAAEKMRLIKEDQRASGDIVWQKNIRGSKGYYFIYYLDKDKSRIVGGFNYLEMRENDRPRTLYQAKEAVYSKEKDLWTLKDVFVIHFDGEIRSSEVEQLPEMEMYLPEDLSFFANPSKDPSELNIFELAGELKQRMEKGLTTRPYEIELHTHFSYPVMNFILGLVGAIGGASGRLRSTGPLIRALLISIITYFTYYVAYRFVLGLGNSGVLSPVIAAWGPTVLFILGALYLVYSFKK